ncbi:MAG: YraN family protein [Treponema sp.]|jgi:putative endonuclease|nr:YraN family protein [Treponema sp.]
MGSKNTSKKGRQGEDRAVAALEAAGLSVIARNVRSPCGEIDIVAQDGDTLVFVEVKTWTSYGIEELRYSVDQRKQKRIVETAKFFLASHREYSSMAVRFDVVFIGSVENRNETITHLVSAFMECI